MNKLDLLLEAERRGILPPDKAGLLAEARRRGLVPGGEKRGRYDTDTHKLVGDPNGDYTMVPQPPKPGEPNVDKDRSRIGDFLKPVFGGHNPIAETYDTFIDPFIPDGKGRSAEEKEWLAKRGVADVAGEAIAAGLSLPGRVLTGGRAGIGDSLSSLGLTGMGEAASQAEADFYQAYRPQVKALSAAGEVALAGSPSLVPRPSFPRAAPPPRRAPGSTVPQQPPAPPPTARQISKQNEAGARLADMEAFRQLNIAPFGPALNDKGIARAARSLEDLPVVGRPVKRAKERVESGLLWGRDRLTGALGAPGTDEAAGRVIQQGLDRYRSARLQDLQPGDVRALGINPQAPARAPGIGRPAAQRAAQAAPAAQQIGANVTQTTRGASRTVPPPSSLVGSGRSTVSSLPDAELDRVIATPSHRTSFATRSEALYEKAYRGLPRLRQADGSPDPMHVDPTNTRRAIRGILDNETEARVRSGVLQGRFGPALQDMVSINSAPGARASQAFTVRNLRAVRTEIGKALSRFDDYDTGLDRQGLSRLYGALSDDIEIGLRDLANRAALGVQSGAVNPDVARRATQAVRDFQVANRYFRAGVGRIEQFQQILKASNPDEAARKIGRALREQTSNMGAVRAVLGALRPEERQAVIGHVIGSWGRNRVGHGDFEQVFNFVNWRVEAEKVLRNPEAARMVLEPLSSEQRRGLASMIRVAHRMEAYERRKNYVNASIGLGGVSAAGLGVGFFNGPAAAALGGLMVGGAALTGHILTSPRYVRWLEQHYRAARLTPRQRAGALRASVARLREIARLDTEHGDDILRLIGAGQGAGPETRPLALPPPSAAESDTQPDRIAAQ